MKKTFEVIKTVLTWLIVLLAVCIACCTPLPLKIYDRIKENIFMRIALVGLLLVLCIAYIVASTNTPFLYFRF